MRALLTIAAAVAALASLSAAPARAFIAQDVYYDDGENSCHNVGSCEVQFSPIKETMLDTQIEQASCTITLPTVAKIGDLLLRRRKGAVINYQTLAPIQALPADGTTTRYLVNAASLLPVQPGERPTIYLALRGGAVSTITLNCTVHGTYHQLLM